eukprot:s565_g10.t1
MLRRFNYDTVTCPTALGPRHAHLLGFPRCQHAETGTPHNFVPVVDTSELGSHGPAGQIHHTKSFELLPKACQHELPLDLL